MSVIDAIIAKKLCGDGATFTPSVSADGTLSWTNNKGLTNPEPVNIKGPQGETGPQGPADGADGKSAYAYAVEGGFTGTEAEFTAKLAAEKLPNPNALTFTGAVTGSYDGSAPLEVAIPSGGNAEKSVRHIATVSVTEETILYNVTVDSNGNAFNLKDAYIFISTFFGVRGGYIECKINNVLVDNMSGTQGQAMSLEIERTGDIQKKTLRSKPTETSVSFGDYYNGKKVATAFQFWVSSVSTDATIEIYGVDA